MRALTKAKAARRASSGGRPACRRPKRAGGSWFRRKPETCSNVYLECHAQQTVLIKITANQCVPTPQGSFRFGTECPYRMPLPPFPHQHWSQTLWPWAPWPSKTPKKQLDGPAKQS